MVNLFAVDASGDDQRLDRVGVDGRIGRVGAERLDEDPCATRGDF